MASTASTSTVWSSKMSTDPMEVAINKLRPEWAQLMANLVLRGWIIRCEPKPHPAFDTWTAHVECSTAEQYEILKAHKELHGLRLYTAPTLLSLLQQMKPVLEEFQAVEAHPHLPDPAKPSRDSLANRTTIITATVRKEQYPT